MNTLSISTQEEEEKHTESEDTPPSLSIYEADIHGDDDIPLTDTDENDPVFDGVDLEGLAEHEPDIDVKTLDEQLSIIERKFNLDNFRVWQNEDSYIRKLIEKWKNATDTDSIRKLYTVKDELLYINNKELQRRYGQKRKKRRTIKVRTTLSLVVPDVTIPDTTISVKWYILREYHGLPTTGHIGVT